MHLTNRFDYSVSIFFDNSIL